MGLGKSAVEVDCVDPVETAMTHAITCPKCQVLAEFKQSGGFGTEPKFLNRAEIDCACHNRIKPCQALYDAAFEAMKAIPVVSGAVRHM
jgi:hypothetical protein